MTWSEPSQSYRDHAAAAGQLPHGPERVRACEQVLAAAQERDSFSEEYLARVLLTEALYYVPDDPALLTHVAWLRAAIEREDGVPPFLRDRALWRMKWAMSQIERMPEIPMSTWVAAVDDLEAALRANGYATRPAEQARANLAEAAGDVAARDAALAAWATTARDGLSDCLSCEARERAVLTADPHAALELQVESLQEGIYCGEGAQSSLAYMAELRWDLGEHQAALEDVQQSMRVGGDDPRNVEAVARCLRVLVRAGNTDRALDALLPRLGWLEELHTAGDRMWFCATASWVLSRAQQAGMAPSTLGGRATTDVIEDLRRTADDLACAFDTRNGSSTVTDRLRQAHDDARVADTPTLVPTRITQDLAGPQLRTGQDVILAALEAREASRDLAAGAARPLAAWNAARTDLLPRLAGPDELAAAGILERLAVVLLEGTPAQLERTRSALELSTRAGDEDSAQKARGDIALLELSAALEAETVDEDAVAAARARVESLAADDEEDGRLESAASLRRWYAITTRPDDVMEQMLAAANLYERAGMRPRQGLALLEAAKLAHPDTDRMEELLQQAEHAGSSNPTVKAGLLDVRARVLAGDGDLQRARELLEQALQIPGAAESVRKGAALTLCDVLLDLEAPAEVEAPARIALEEALATGDTATLAVAHHCLGVAWLNTGRPAEAAEVLEAALPVLTDELPDRLAPAAWALGNAYQQLSSWAASRRSFATASLAFEAAGHPVEAGHAQYRAGNSAWEDQDHEAARAHFDEAIDRAHANGDPDLLLAAMRNRAALRAETEDLDAGIADLDAVPRVVTAFAADLPDPPQLDLTGVQPSLLRQSAYVLAGAGRVDDAVERMERATAQLEGEAALAMRAERAALLADADRLPECESDLREVLVQLRAAGMHRERVAAARALAGALDNDGRDEQAQEVWERYGPNS